MTGEKRELTQMLQITELLECFEGCRQASRAGGISNSTLLRAAEINTQASLVRGSRSRRLQTRRHCHARRTVHARDRSSEEVAVAVEAASP